MTVTSLRNNMRANNSGKPLTTRYMSNSQLSNSHSHLLVICETSHQKQIIKAFQDFEKEYGVDCSNIIKGIENHGKYFTFGELWLKFNSKLNFLQKFRSKDEDVRKLEGFYKTFNPEHSFFRTITRKTLSLDKPIITFPVESAGDPFFEFSGRKKKPKIEFLEINQAENNLRQLFWRLDTYGFPIKRYILVVEIKESGGFFNYHHHAIIEAYPDIAKIRSNPNKKYRTLVFNPSLNKDIATGWINNPTLSQIWKDITKDGSYRIKPEVIRKREGAFHYLLSYMNKGIQYETIAAIPKMYFALKSKKAYRVKGMKDVPKIKYKVLTKEGREINSPFYRRSFCSEEEIPVVSQEYKLKIMQGYKNDNPYIHHMSKLLWKEIETKTIKQEFSNRDDKKRSIFDKKLKENRELFDIPGNWFEIYSVFSPEEVEKLLREGVIFETWDGYHWLV